MTKATVQRKPKGLDMGEDKKIIIISDGTGKTARRLLDAVLAQYSEQQVDFALVETFCEVRTQQQANEILKRITDDFLVIISIISAELGDYLHQKLEKRSILHLNVLDPMLQTMWKFLGVHPVYKPGLLQTIDDRYYQKIDAIGYSAEHDDGRGFRLQEADVVLVGLSRTCKTPISMYMSCHYGLKVANIPIVADEIMKQQLLDRLAAVDKRIIMGLIMQPDSLLHAREERAHVLSADDFGQRKMHAYYDLREIRDEVRFSRLLYDEHGWPVIDVSRRAIEEISLEILRRLKD
jgi:regulator of PEP synthase PpsR (kinase-PPPase family)